MKLSRSYSLGIVAFALVASAGCATHPRANAHSYRGARGDEILTEYRVKGPSSAFGLVVPNRDEHGIRSASYKLLPDDKGESRPIYLEAATRTVRHRLENSATAGWSVTVRGVLLKRGKCKFLRVERVERY